MSSCGVYPIELFRIFVPIRTGRSVPYDIPPPGCRDPATCNSGLPQTEPHDTRSRHSHRIGLYRRLVRRGMAFGPPGRQCGLLHRQPPHAVVYGGLCDDRRGNVGRHLHLGPGVGGRRFLLLPADGCRVHGGAAHRGLRADPDLLPPAGGLALRIPRRPLRRRLAPHRGLVLFPFEDARRRPARLRRLRGAPAAGLRPLRHPVLGQRPGDDGARLALHAAGGRQVADLDRYAQDAVPGREPRAVDPLHHAGAGPFGR